MSALQENYIFKQSSQIVSSGVILYKYHNSAETPLGSKSAAIIPNEFNKDIFNIICYQTKNRTLEFSIPINPVASLSKYKFSFTIFDGNIIIFHDHMSASLQWKLQFPDRKIFNQFVTALTMVRIPNISFKTKQNLIIQDLNIPSTDIQYKYDKNAKIKINTHLKIWIFSSKHPYEKGPLVFNQEKLINMHSDKVLPALRDGLIAVKQDAVRLIIASPKMCFAKKGNKALNIAPDSALIFQVKVIKIHIENESGSKSNHSNEVKEEKQMEMVNFEEKFALYDARLDSLSMGLMNIQNSMNTICEQINDLRLIVTEEKKTDVVNLNELTHIKKEIETLKKLINFNGDTDLYKVQLWMMNDVGLPEYTKLFIENGFDNMAVVKTITFNDLGLLGIDKLGHKKRIIQKVMLLNDVIHVDVQYEGVAFND